MKIIKKLNEEIKKEFLRIEPKVLKLIATQPIENLIFDKGNGDEIKDEDKSKKYFEISLKPKYAKTGSGINFIRIEGDLSPANFMNNLSNEIDKKFKKIAKLMKAIKH